MQLLIYDFNVWNFICYGNEKLIFYGIENAIKLT